MPEPADANTAVHRKICVTIGRNRIVVPEHEVAAVRQPLGDAHREDRPPELDASEHGEVRLDSLTAQRMRAVLAFSLRLPP